MKNERQEKIIEILNEKEYATVGYLADSLYASLPTIRRDLSELARRGLIQRSHGGAAIVNDRRLAVPFDFRTGSGREIKIRMSRAAAKLVSDGDTVFIDGSTSCMHIGDFLRNRKNLTVVTNSAVLPAKLADFGFDVHCTGGRLIESSLCFVGSRAIKYAGDFHFDIMFFSSSAVSETGIVTDYSQTETELRRAVFSGTDKKILLCDSSKFNKSAAFFVTRSSSVDLIITDKNPDFECAHKLIV